MTALALRAGAGAGVVVAAALCVAAALDAAPGRGSAAPVVATRPAPPPVVTRYVAPGGVPEGPCSAARPCDALATALRVAWPGERVELAAGDSGPQELPADVDLSAAPVVVAPVPGARVRLAYLELLGGGVEVRDLTTRGFAARPGSHDLTLRRLDVQGAFFITSAKRVRLLSSRVGPADGVDPQIKAADTTGAPVPEDVVIDRTTFHDFTRRADPSAHVECLQVGAARRLRITRSTFTRCATQDVLLKSFGGTATIDDVVLEANVLDRSLEGFHALRISANGAPYTGVRVAYTSALQSLVADVDAVRGMRWVGNVAPRRRGDCPAGQAFSHDVWDGVRCSRSDRRAPAGFVDPGRLDLRLGARSRARRAGDPDDPPASDRAGRHPRRGSAPDAGAFQR